jgi:hypothetical protein
MSAHCRVLPLELGRGFVRYRWEARPPHPVWAREEFSVEYEGDIDLTAMPRALLWTTFLGCTHPIWALLDGYDLEFSEAVDFAELEFWMAMGEASRRASGLPSSAAGASGARLHSSGGSVTVSAPPTTPLSRAPAVLLSCGKESLLSLGLLREVCGEVVAVSVHSPMPGTADHESSFRAQAQAVLGNSAGVTVRRVRSDVRSTWKNDYAVLGGGLASINELADCFVYPSLALPIAYQYRLPFVALGSEWGEHQVPIRAADGWRFDRYFSLSGMALAAVGRLWQSRYGTGYTSVIQPISQYLVERILLQRYPDLARFQHSCYRARQDVRACQLCEKCARVTALALAAGADPLLIGMDVNRVFSRWNATAVELEGGRADTHYASMNEMIRFALSKVDRRRARAHFRHRTWADVQRLRPWRSSRRFNRILDAIGPVASSRLDTVKRGYLDSLPVEVRGPIGKILAESAADDTTDDSAVLADRAAVLDMLTAALRPPAHEAALQAV